MNLKIRFHKNQFKIHKDKHRFKVVRAGRRFGKSTMSRSEVLESCIREPGLYRIVAPTFSMGKDIHWTQGYCEELDGKVGKILGAEFNKTDLSINFPLIGSMIQIRSADNPDRLVGVKCRGIVSDEISQMDNWDDIWERSLRPSLADFKGWGLFISTPRGFDHFHKLCKKEDDNDNYKSFHFTSYDNPHIDPKEIDDARKEVTEAFFKQEFLAEFTEHTGLVYKEFKDEFIHELKFKPIYWIRGLDRGYRNPTAIPIIAVDENDNWHQVFEIYASELTNKDIKVRLDEIKDKISKIDPHFADFEYSTGDSEAIGDLKDLELNYNEYFEPVKKISGEGRVNYVIYKIQKFANRLKSKKYSISPQCEKTISEFKRYSYSDKNEDEKPIKEHDHSLDALADLNSMYEHYYNPSVNDKPEGTYIKPYLSIIEDGEINTSNGIWLN